MSLTGAEHVGILPVPLSHQRRKPGSGNRFGTRWRGKIPIPPHAHPLVRQFIEIANDQQTTMCEIAERVGIRDRTVSNWRYRAVPQLALFEAALNVLDYELVIRKRRCP